jgi:hypothetical protein
MGISRIGSEAEVAEKDEVVELLGVGTVECVGFLSLYLR